MEHADRLLGRLQADYQDYWIAVTQSVQMGWGNWERREWVSGPVKVAGDLDDVTLTDAQRAAHVTAGLRHR